MAITQKSKAEIEKICDVEYFDLNRVTKSFYLICEELAYKYYGSRRISKEKLYKFMINLLFYGGHQADDDRFMDWYGAIYHQFAEMLESRIEELPVDDDYIEIYRD